MQAGQRRSVQSQGCVDLALWGLLSASRWRCGPIAWETAEAADPIQTTRARWPSWPRVAWSPLHVCRTKRQCSPWRRQRIHAAAGNSGKVMVKHWSGVNQINHNKKMSFLNFLFMIYISPWHSPYGWVMLDIRYLAATGWRCSLCGFCFTVPIWLLFGFYSAVPLRFVCGFYSTVVIRVHYYFFTMVPIWFLCDFPD